ncbi:MAG: winged helix-turn-helix transcriptional regulator [Candidatus Limnocylindrales bacterium]|jgi:DNA-binding HxlR family transcriptional regulator
MAPTTEPEPPPTSEPEPPSPLDAALQRVGDRWSLLIVETLLDGPRRFKELGQALPGLAPNILTGRLRRLEREGVVVGLPYSQRPLRLEYRLTGDGRRLASALRLLADWGGRRSVGAGTEHEPLRHATCGTQLEARWYCPTCDLPVADHEAPDRRVV